MNHTFPNISYVDVWAMSQWTPLPRYHLPKPYTWPLIQPIIKTTHTTPQATSFKLSPSLPEVNLKHGLIQHLTQPLNKISPDLSRNLSPSPSLNVSTNETLTQPSFKSLNIMPNLSPNLFTKPHIIYSVGLHPTYFRPSHQTFHTAFHTTSHSAPLPMS